MMLKSTLIATAGLPLALLLGTAADAHPAKHHHPHYRMCRHAHCHWVVPRKPHPVGDNGPDKHKSATLDKNNGPDK